MAHTLPSNPSDTVWRFTPRTRQSGKRSAPARHSWHLRALAASILAFVAILGYSAQAEAQTVPTTPILTAVKDVDNPHTRVKLSWTPSTPSSGGTITGYRLEVSDNNTDWSVLNNLQFGATASSYSHSGLEAGTRKWYRVKAEESRVVGGETVYEYGPTSVAKSATTDPPTAPGAPQLLLADPGNGQVVLSWIKPSSDGGRAITDYEYRYNDGTSWIQWASAGIDQGIDQTVTVPSLTNDTLYTFEVRARNSEDLAGVGPAAPPQGERLVTATPKASPPETSPPETPQSLEAAPGNGQVVLTWTAPSSNGGETITDYQYRYHEGTGPVPDSEAWSSAGTDFTETVGNLTNGTEYTFELRAENSAGFGPWASVTAAPTAPPPPPVPTPIVPTPIVPTPIVPTPIVPTPIVTPPIVTPPIVTPPIVTPPVTTPIVTAPSTLQDLEAESGDGQVVLMWTAPSSTGGATITGYEYRYHEGTGPVPDSVTWSSAGTDLTETVDTLTNGTEYTFELRAVNSVGPGPATSVTATPSAPATPPVAEAGENRTIAQGEEITLDGSASTDPAGGTLAYQWTYTGDRTDITLTDAATATPTVTAPTGLTADAVLTFSLVVTDENGSSSAADTVEITVTSQAVREDGTDALTFHPKTGDEVWISAGTTVTLQVLPEGRSAPAGLAVTLPAEALTGASPTLTIDVDPAESAGFRLGMTVVDITLTGGSIPAGKTATVCLPGTDSHAMLHLYDEATETWQPLSSSHSETHNGVTVMCADTATFSLFGVFQSDVAQQHDPVVDTEHKVVAQAWLARVGRTVAGQAMDMINTRLTGASTGASHLTLGGQTLNLNAERDARSGDGGGGLLRADGWDESRRMGREVAVDEFLLGSSFSLSAAANADGSGARWTAWGRGATTRFDGEDETLSIDGQVATGTLGADYEWGPLMAGVAVTHSRGAGDVDGPSAGQGEMETSLTSVYPYLRYKAHERVSVWGLLGYGRGEMSLEQAAARRIETDLAMRMGAVGIRGSLWSATETGGIDLAVKSDLFMVQMQSDEVAELPEVEADARRVRLLVEGSRAMAVGTEAQVTPSVEIGVRYDGGDAETGTGVEIGGGLRYTHTGWRLTTEVTARALLAHQESSYKEWGVGGSVRLLPDEAGRGLSLRLNSSWGAAASGATQMWAQQPLAGATATGPAQPVAQLNAELGYGLRSLDGRGLVTPYAGVTLAENGVQASRLGTRFSLNETVTLSLEGTRMERADTVTEHGVLFRAAMRW